MYWDCSLKLSTIRGIVFGVSIDNKAGRKIVKLRVIGKISIRNVGIDNEIFQQFKMKFSKVVSHKALYFTPWRKYRSVEQELKNHRYFSGVFFKDEGTFHKKGQTQNPDKNMLAILLWLKIWPGGVKLEYSWDFSPSLYLW